MLGSLEYVTQTQNGPAWDYFISVVTCYNWISINVLVLLQGAGQKKYDRVLSLAERLLAGEVQSTATEPDYEGVRAIRQPHRRITPDEAAAIGEEYRGGRSTQEIADARGINRGTVSILVRRVGVPIRRAELSPDQLAEASELYSAGWSLNRLGQRYGLDPKTIKRRLASGSS